MKKIFHLWMLIALCSAAFLGSCTDDNTSDNNTSTATATAPSVTGNPAIDGLTAQIKENPSDASLYAHRAGAWIEMEGYDEAIEDLNQAIMLDSTQPTYFHELSNVYLDYYRSRMAMLTMEKASELFPRNILTLLKTAEVQLILKQYDRALYSLERIRAIEPANSEMFFMFGRVFEEMGRIDEAKGAYQKAIEQDSDLVDAYVKMGQILMSEKDDRAIRYLDNALRISPDDIGAIHAKANYLAQMEDNLPEAIALFKKINVLQPQFEEGYYNLGLLYLDADSLDKAYESFDIAIKTQPDFVESYFYRGMASKLKGDVAAAKADFERALRLNPEYTAAQIQLEEL